MVYKWYILPIGGLYATYHLLGEPETTIDVTDAERTNQSTQPRGPCSLAFLSAQQGPFPDIQMQAKTGNEFPSIII